MPKTPKMNQKQPKQEAISPVPTLPEAINTPQSNPTNLTENPAKGLKGKKRLMIMALEKTRGIILHAAPLAGVDRAAHYYWLEHDPKYAEAFRMVRFGRLEMALSCIMEELATGPRRFEAAKFILENEGQALGYGLKQHTAVQVNTAVAPGPTIEDLKKILLKPEDEEKKTEEGESPKQAKEGTKQCKDSKKE